MNSVKSPRHAQRFVTRFRLLCFGLAILLAVILFHAVPSEDIPTALAVLGMSLLSGAFVAVGRPLLPVGSGDSISPWGHAEDWPEIAAAQHSIADSLRRLAGQSDCILLEAAVAQLVQIQEELRNLANGQIVFTATETWRTVYDEILRSPGIGCYRSVAWIRNEDYWQDVPGQHSMQTNYDLLEEGVRIERILILSDFFWPRAATLPAPDIRRWIDQQHKRGISILLVRESSIDTETDSLCDIGIYGTRATGTLELDSQCRSTRFTFDFSPEAIRLAEERWKHLCLYGVSYGELLDRSARGA